jgi:sulfur carrier protein
MPLSLVINGHSRNFPEINSPATLDLLVAELGLKADRVAIELNGEIASRASWAATALHEGDRLEVVHFVGGGCGCVGWRDCDGLHKGLEDSSRC